MRYTPQVSPSEIHISRRGKSGHILLDRPQALNAVTLKMVRAIAAALDAWEHDPNIMCVVVEAAGEKAFCAGGDVRKLYEQGKAGEHDAQLSFWREEYILNERIRSYPKPYVALIDGIVMGGGVGISLHGSHRVAGDRFLFAMPEVGIGFFPDVGATYLLPRLPGRVGAYLAMTGARVKAGGAVAVSLVDAFVSSARMAEVAPALAESGDADAVLAKFREPPPPSVLDRERTLLDHCFDAPCPVEMIARLDRDGGEYARSIAKMLREKCPTSIAIAHRQMRVGGALDMKEAMRTEFRIVSRVCRGTQFLEGVRSTIIDKDMTPQWSPATLDAISAADIDAYFAPLAADELVFSR